MKMWHVVFETWVIVLRTGHFPSTSIVRLPDGREVETDNYNLKDKPV